jgi:hypothetical protein
MIVRTAARSVIGASLCHTSAADAWSIQRSRRVEALRNLGYELAAVVALVLDRSPQGAEQFDPRGSQMLSRLEQVHRFRTNRQRQALEAQRKSQR